MTSARNNKQRIAPEELSDTNSNSLTLEAIQGVISKDKEWKYCKQDILKAIEKVESNIDESLSALEIKLDNIDSMTQLTQTLGEE